MTNITHAQMLASGRKRRQDILAFIQLFKRAHQGIAPSVREIAAHTGISTPSVVSYHLDILQKKGALTLVRNSKGRPMARAIILTGEKWQPPEA